MITTGRRRAGQPVYVNGNETVKLERIPFLEKTFKEDWIQRLIHLEPHILPIEEIEVNFSPLIAIGREVSTISGYIDNLYISPDGYITIVETKLWRNPEARREVVGQILDYAKEISKWTFNDLENSVIAYNRLYEQNTDGLLTTIRRYEPLDESEEQYFIDNINKNLKRGRFLLLIVGDGIREGVEDMVEYLSQSPQLQFTLALIELQVFKFKSEKNSFIVVPQIITRTKEITRAIIRIEGNTDKLNINVDAVLENENSDNKNTITKQFSITEEDFFTQLEQNTNKAIAEFAKEIIKDSEKSGYIIDWAQGSFVVKLIDPRGSGTKITLFVVDRKSLLYLTSAAKQLERLGLNKELSYTFATNTAKLFKKLDGSIPYSQDHWSKSMRLPDLQPVYKEFKEQVDMFVEEINQSI